MRTTYAVMVAVLFTSCAFAQGNLTGSARPKNVVTMAPIAPVRVTLGKPSRLALTFRVAPGYHINSNKPRSELLIPTNLKLDAQTGLGIGKVTYPAGENLTFPFAPNDKLNVYTGDFTITALISAAHDTPLGRYRIHGELTSQACDNKACYPPKTLPVAFDVRVQRAASARARRNPGQSPHIRH